MARTNPRRSPRRPLIMPKPNHRPAFDLGMDKKCDFFDQTGNDGGGGMLALRMCV